MREEHMNEMERFLRVLKTLIGKAASFPLFLIQAENSVFTITFPKEKMKEGASVSFKLGREFAQAHPHVDPARANVFQVTPGHQGDTQTEMVVVSLVDKSTQQMNGIPFKVTRDAQGSLVDLVDEGGIVEVAGTFLPAFLVGMRTARFPEKQALVMFDQEMERLTAGLRAEMKRRGMDTTGIL